MHPTHDRITRTQSSFPYQNGGDGSTARVDFGFHHMTGGEFVWIGFKLQHFGLKQYQFEQFVNPLGLLGRNVDINRFAAPVFRSQADFGELPLHFFGFCILFIDFVYGDNYGYLGRFCMVNGFYCLRHNPVIGSNHQNHNIGNLSASSSHGGECFMAGCI